MVGSLEPYQDISEKIEALQNILISHSTGGQVTEQQYRQLRSELLNDPSLSPKLPRFVRTCSDLKQFWVFIKEKSSSYQGRREYLKEQFKPLLVSKAAPHMPSITGTLKALDSDHVHEAWRSALERRLDDPDGAITSARTLIETVCKHILDHAGVPYENDSTLPKLYKLTAETLQLAPSQQTEPILRQVLGGCTAVIEGIGAMRNALGDAHGKGKSSAKPDPSHAELAVNLAGASAVFLIETWEGMYAK